MHVLMLKYIYILADTGESMMIRGCAVDSGTLTTDTEIIRMSHCGAFYFDKRLKPQEEVF